MGGVKRLEPEEVGIGRLFYSMRDAVVVASAVDECIHLWNPAASKIFGYSEEEVRGMPLDTIVTPALRERHHAGIRRFASTGSGELIDSHTSVELPAVRADGSEITVELTLTPIKDARPELSLVAAFIRDVTARKRLEEEREHFVAMVAHDIMSPLTVVSGMTELLGRKPLDDQGLVMLDAIARNSDKALAVARDLTEAASIESGSFTLVPGTFDLYELVTARVAELAAIHTDRVISVASQARAQVVGDELRTSQVLGNLLGNALKFSSGNVSTSMGMSGSFGRVTVTDQGPGMETSAMTHMFDKFTRGTDSQPGTGLGLYISRLLVEAQGGHIGAESAPGAGSTFWFELPLAGDR
jgi:PAS domain S-box-containing protein